MSQTAVADPVPVIEDLSIYIVGGRADPKFAIPQAMEAERLGFRRVWFCERLNLKDAGVVLGAIAAKTSRIEIGTAPVTAMARSPVVTASIGATVHTAFGPRCILGLGRGPAGHIAAYGNPGATYAQMVEYVETIRRLWRGETVSYHGPSGSFSEATLPDTYDGPPPEVWYVGLGGPKASRTSANTVFDGMMLGPPATPEAVAQSVAWAREECERLGRDPASLRICAGVAAAPRVEAVGEDVASMTNPAYGSQGYVTPEGLRGFLCLILNTKDAVAPGGIIERNGWKRKDIDRIVDHPVAQEIMAAARAAGKRVELADQAVRDRTLLAQWAAEIPDSWLQDRVRHRIGTRVRREASGLSRRRRRRGRHLRC